MDAGAIDASSAVPKYMQLAAWLREKIKAGEVTRLPSEMILAAGHGVSRGTAREALKVLKHEGLIRSVPGVGWEAVPPG